MRWAWIAASSYIEDLGPGVSAMNALSLILDALAPIAGRATLDIGCGSGSLAASLAGKGAVVTGIDPNPDAIMAARRAVPAGTFLVGSAEALPLPDASRDGAVMLNSLHHVPSPSAGLREASRALRPGGPLVVVEPLAYGSAFDALRLIDDETAIRAIAQEALAALLAAGVFRCGRDLTFEREERFADLDGFLARVAAVDPGRLATIAARRPEIADTFARVAAREPDGRFLLRQPLRVHVLILERGAA